VPQNDRSNRMATAGPNAEVRPGGMSFFFKYICA
jgi:hypothetical protein